MTSHLFSLSLVMALFLAAPVGAQDQVAKPPATAGDLSLTAEQASRFARLALNCLGREYPNKPEHVLNSAADVQGPKALHPAFYGCYDWHSSVHGHWMLVRLLRLFPALPEAKEIRGVLNQNLSSQNIKAEVAYLEQPNRQSFERIYGWAWLLKLHEELRSLNNPDGNRWARDLQPLTDAIAFRFREFLPKQRFPIRTGVHPNTAFGLSLALDYARATGDRTLEQTVLERSRRYFGADKDYPAVWEPGGEDFLSPALVEADLMRRVLESVQFQDWLQNFLPGLSFRRYEALFTPVGATDHSDPKLVHLDGLNLSRAWCMRGIAGALPESDPRRKVLLEAADRHARAGLDYVASGGYTGEHWLASFAVFMLSTDPRDPVSLPQPRKRRE